MKKVTGNYFSSMWSVAVFCGTLSLTLPHWTVSAAFGSALLVTIVSHAVVQPR